MHLQNERVNERWFVHFLLIRIGFQTTRIVSKCEVRVPGSNSCEKGDSHSGVVLGRAISQALHSESTTK